MTGTLEPKEVTKADPVTQATVTARYYTELIKGGVPEDLAEDLTREWHASLLSTVMAYEVGNTGQIRLQIPAPSSLFSKEPGA